ncbi:MAG: hypothetical protein MMC23_001577 [Stictis urceolatum]|nr:hypothetical protein [Stictis urceolata]
MYTHHVLANRSRTPSLSNSLNSASSAGSPDLPAGDIPRHLLAHEPTRSQTPAPVNHNSPYAPQPLSMPPHFITSFVHRCFVVDLAEVDFTQALKAMDYLKVFDDRRKREFCAALRRLNIDTSIWDYEKASIMNENPSMYDWIVSVEDKSRRVEALYTQVYIGLRRWTLINEMRLMPFNKVNCTAMLDTLYPKHYSAPPTPQLTETILNSQRNAFRRYIEAVEANGRNVLQTLEHQSRRDGDTNGWPVVREIVDKYLTSTNNLLDECNAVKGPEDFVPSQTPTPGPSARVDSGVSFQEPPDAEKRPSSRPPIPRMQSSPAPPERTRPSQPTCTDRKAGAPERKGSAFGRLARVFKSRSVDGRADEEGHSGRRSVSGRRSTSAMGRDGEARPRTSAEKQHSRENSADRAAGLSGGLGIIDIDDKQREKLIREARRAKEEREVRRVGPTHFKTGEERRGGAGAGVGVGMSVPEKAAKNLGLPRGYRLEEEEGRKEEERVPCRQRGVLRVYVEDEAHGARGRYFNPYQAPAEELVIAELAA